MRDLAAQAAADATFDHGRDRIAAQRIGIFLDGQRRAARQANAGVITSADLIVDAELRFRDTAAGGDVLGILRAHAALLCQHAFAFGDDDLEALLRSGQRLAQDFRDLADLVVVDGAHPLHADTAQGLFD